MRFRLSSLLQPSAGALSLLFTVLAACGGNVILDAAGTGAGGTGTTSTTGAVGGGGEAPNPWIVPGPCTYTCDGAPCPTPCAPGQTPGPNPYTCCNGAEDCQTPQEPPAGVTATCPACLPGWTTSSSMPQFCCLNDNCYSPATGAIDVQVFAAGPTCQGANGSCGCSLTSQDGHEYAVVCDTGACTCERDTTTVQTIAWLCPASGALDSSYMLWACGFPPI